MPTGTRVVPSIVRSPPHAAPGPIDPARLDLARRPADERWASVGPGGFGSAEAPQHLAEAERRAAPSARRSWRTTGAGRAGARRSPRRRRCACRTRRGCGSRVTYRHSRAEQQLAQDRERDADRAEAVVDQQRAAVGRPDAPQSRMSARAGRVPVGAVDVQHVDRVGDLAVGDVGERARRGEPGRRRRRRRGWPRNTSWSSLAASAKPSISCGPRSLPACGSIATISTPSARGRGEHDRAATAEAADLDDPAAGRHPGRGVVQRLRLVVASSSRRPSATAVPVPRRTLRRSSRVHRQSRRSTTHTSPSSWSTRSPTKTSSGAAPWPCSSISA